MLDFKKITRLAKEGATTERDFTKVLKGIDTRDQSRGLGLEEAALLLNTEDKALLAELYKKAAQVKERIFGKRVVLFAPLYLSNYCINGCLYCGFRNAGKETPRKALTPAEVVQEARALIAMGFKRVLLVTGEDPRWGLDYIISCVNAIYKETDMRIIHLNAPPLGVAELRTLKEADVGVFQVFQETYHRETYARMHPFGPKSDFDYRLGVMDRAVEAGFGDLGIGPLLGLYDYKFDSLATIAHSRYLYDTYGAHAHTLSIPRLRPAAGSHLPEIPYEVGDEELKKIVAVFRLAVPTAGVVVSTRESAELRKTLLHIGASQLSAASRTDPGGYTEGKGDTEEITGPEQDMASTTGQFSTSDHSGLAEVMRSITGEGFVPSLCTTCYRVGRTGAAFSHITGAGHMEKNCSANAALTIKEFILDHRDENLEPPLEAAIEKCLAEIRDPAMKKEVLKKLHEIECGKRDIFF
ncbi:MAG: [FeFe] hydrogenase H-cluster radical SAM maturase HydG [Thermodesulfobacteriota bacterium]